MGIPISFKNRIVKDYEVEIVTPMFLGGEDGISAMLRTYPWKGLLRYWWRAISNFENSQQLYEEESKIFGSTNQKSKFKIEVERKNLKLSNENFEFGKKYTYIKDNQRREAYVLMYLAYGAINRGKNKPNRYHLCADNSFKLTITYSNQKILEEVERALFALQQFGGLGAKAKNGFGNIYISNLENYSFNMNNYKKLRSFPSFSSNTKVIWESKKVHKTWVDALSEIGSKYIMARTKMGDSAEDNFKFRRHLAAPLQTREGKYRRDRQAKMIWLHVDKVGENAYKGKIFYMPYKIGNNRCTEQLLNAYEKLIKLIQEEV